MAETFSHPSDADPAQPVDPADPAELVDHGDDDLAEPAELVDHRDADLADPDELAVPTAPAENTELVDRSARFAPKQRTAMIVLSVALAVILGYAAVAWALADRVPRGTTVAGVSIGGMSSTEAKSTLAEGLAEVTSEPVTVVVDQVEGQFAPADVGLVFDADATVRQVVGFTLSPARLWQFIAGSTEVAPVSEVDEAALASTLEEMAPNFALLPVDASIQFEGVKPVASPSEDGLEVDIEGAVQTIALDWITGPRPLPLPTDATKPTITNDEVDRVMVEQADPLVEAPIRAVVAEQTVDFSPELLAAAASFEPSGSRLEMALDGQKLALHLRESVPELESAPVDASFELTEDGPKIIADSTGTAVDADELAANILAATHTEERTVEVPIVEVEADLNLAAAEALGVKERISEFSTNLTSDAVRTENLRTGAAAIDGVLVLPGETFSLLDTLDPITEENGYGGAGILIDGVIVEGIGGGLSQLATTLYNAVFFAGLEVVEHQPHSQYISRYPEGREATIYVPSIDMKFRNDSDFGVLIESWVADGQIHVAFWSTKVWEIRAETSGRSEIVQPTTVTSNRAGCVPTGAGQPGFLVTVYRHFYKGGELIKTESDGWRYQPENAVVCG